MSTLPTPEWLIEEPFTETDLGVIRSGKEAQINLIERTNDDGESCLLVHKRYLPREVKEKGELEALGVQRSSAFRHDVEYREGRQFRRSRDRRAIERMTAHGRRLLGDRWTSHEFDVLGTLWAAGVAVPYPVSFANDVCTMAYIGHRDQAAPRLAETRLNPDELALAAEQLIDNLYRITATGWAHGDLSAYNLLWWHDQLWFIDVPQAVDLAANPQGLDYLHRDITNISTWFRRRGHPIDAEALFAELVGVAFQ